MKKCFRGLWFVLLTCLLSSCRADNKPQTTQATPQPKRAESVAVEGIDALEHFDSGVLLGRIAFLSGAEVGRGKVLRLDTQQGKAAAVALPANETVMTLCVSPEGECLVVACAARTGDDSGKMDYTLFTLDNAGTVTSQTPLAGVDAVNFLAIGTPRVNGVTRIGPHILLIINNRLLLLDKRGDYLDSMIWAGAHPRLAGTAAETAYIYENSSNGCVLTAVRVSGGKLQSEPVSLTDDILGVIPTGRGEHIFVAGRKNVYSIRDDARKTSSWELPFGFSPEKEYFYNGEDLLLELYHGRVSFSAIG